MTSYKPRVREVLCDIPEMAAAAFDNNVRPAIAVYGPDYEMKFGEMVGGMFRWRVGLGKIDLKGTDVETALRAEAEAFGESAPNIALVYDGKIIQEGKAIGSKKDRTPYEIHLKAPTVFWVRDGYLVGSRGIEGRIILYGFNLEAATGFGAGNPSKKADALAVGQALAWGDDAVVRDFLPYAGNKDYFVQGQWTHTDMRSDMGFKVENIAYGIRRNEDRTLEIIPVHTSFRDIVTPEAVQRVLKTLKKE
jgi:hypothetical protein